MGQSKFGVQNRAGVFSCLWGGEACHCLFSVFRVLWMECVPPPQKLILKPDPQVMVSEVRPLWVMRS